MKMVAVAREKVERPQALHSTKDSSSTPANPHAVFWPTLRHSAPDNVRNPASGTSAPHKMSLP
jgi:hypothetical protein